MSTEPDTQSGIDSQTEDDSTDTSIADLERRLAELEDGSGDNSDDYIEDKQPEWVFDKFAERWTADGKAQSGLQSYQSAWSQFREWMEQKGYRYLTDLTPSFPARHDDWIVAHDEYDKTKLSRSMHLSRIKTVVRHAESRGWIDPDIIPGDDRWDEIKPELGDGDKIRSDPLRPERGERITNWVRANHFGERSHILWLLLFRYGFRVSAIRALDRDDLRLSEPDDWPEERDFRPHLRLKDRPELGDDDDKGLPLKNKREELAGRLVPLQREHVDAFRHYVQNGSEHGAETRKEHDEPDEYGLYGLLTGEHNARLSGDTIRGESGRLTSPATYANKCQCDGCQQFRSEQGRDPYPSRIHKHCNESRTPHQVRHGAITSLLDDADHGTVASIVGTSPDTLRDVYDRADEYRRMNRIADDWSQ